MREPNTKLSTGIKLLNHLNYKHGNKELAYMLMNSYCSNIYKQTWSSRDLSLGLETSRDPFLQVLVSVLVLNLGVLVLVLEPSSLGLGLGTWDHEDLVFVTHEA